MDLLCPFLMLNIEQLLPLLSYTRDLSATVKKWGLKYKVLSLARCDFCGAVCNPTDCIYLAVSAIYWHSHENKEGTNTF